MVSPENFILTFMTGDGFSNPFHDISIEISIVVDVLLAEEAEKKITDCGEVM